MLVYLSERETHEHNQEEHTHEHSEEHVHEHHHQSENSSDAQSNSEHHLHHHTDQKKHAKHFFGLHREHHVKEESSFGKLKQFLWDNRQIIFLLVAVFLLAFGIRAHLLRYTYLFEFDAFYHARLVEQMATVGHIVSPDPSVYYEVIGGVAAQPASLYHYISLVGYEIINLGGPFNKDLLMWWMQFNPVLFGSLICIVMYFLGKEVFNRRKIGLITAFVAAVTPAFAYRTMAGAQGDNAFGFLFMVIGFVYFVRSVKVNGIDRSALINVVLGGVFFGLMAMTWRMYLLIPLIIIGYTLFALWFVATKQENKPTSWKDNQVIILGIKIFIAMLIFHVMTYAYGEDWIGDAFSIVGGAISANPLQMLILTLVAIIAVFLISAFWIVKQSEENKKYLFWVVIIGLYVVVVAMVFFFLTKPDLVDRTTISSMVGEESVGNSFFGTKYNAAIIFPWLALIIFPISLFLYKRKDMHPAIIFFMWVAITLFMAWYKLKFTFVFGLAIAAAVAIVVFILIEGLKKFSIERGIEARVILGVLFILILFGVGASARFFPDYVPYVDENPQWRTAQDWIITNTPTDAKFFNWWDQGHILAFLTDRKYSTDNRNAYGPANTALAKFAITTDTNVGYQIASKEIGADYIVLDSSMFSSAPTFEFYVANKIDYSLVTKYQTGIIRIMNCVDDNSSTINCENNQLTRAQWDGLATTWKSIPDDFYNGTEPLFYYRSNSNFIVLNSAMNNTNLAKVWMDSNETSKYYDIAYNAGGIMILKIKK